MNTSLVVSPSENLDFLPSKARPLSGLRRLPARLATSRGFSLVEVVMALGIFAFAFVGIIALIPIALHTHLDAKIETIQAQIEQRLAAEALLTDYSKLPNLDGKICYFDEEGVEVDPASAKPNPVIFTSKTVVTTVAFPSNYAPNSIKNVIFYAIHDPGKKGITASTKPAGSILIANTSTSS